MKRNFVYFLISLCVGNLFYFCFFYEKEYGKVAVRTEINCANPTKIWYVYKEKFSEKRFFSDKEDFLPNQNYSHQFEIVSKNEIEYIGLYWQTEEESSIKIKSYAYSVEGKWFSETDYRKILEYVSTGSRIFEGDKSIEVQSAKGGPNWVMLNSTEDLNKMRSVKVHNFIPVWGNICIMAMSLMFLLIFPKPGQFNIMGRIRWTGPKVLKRIFLLWTFIMPFWIIVSHTLMAISVVLSLYLWFNKKKLRGLFLELKTNYFFYVFYVWILLSSFMVDEPAVAMKIAVDYSYFLMLPIAYAYIGKEELKKVFDFFEKGVLLYFFLLMIYVINSYFKVAPEGSIFKFVEACVERFWHTSYLSLLLLLLFIKHLKTPLKNNFSLLVFFSLALFFMYVVNARMPFIVGLLLLAVKSILLLDFKKIQLLLFGLVMLCLTAFAVFFVTKNSTIMDIPSNGTNADARISLWKASIGQMGDHYLFGVGNEGTQKAIAQVDRNVDTKFRNYNAHNQFLETALGHGIIAFLILIAVLIGLFRKGGVFAISFVLCCALLFMVESYLNRQAGMIIFTFWYCFFLKTDSKT